MDETGDDQHYETNANSAGLSAPPPARADLTARTRWASTHVAPRCCGCRCCCCPSDGCQAAGEVLIKIAKGKLPACVDKESVKLGEMEEKGGLAMKNDR